MKRMTTAIHHPTLSLIAIVARNGGIGHNSGLLWYLSEDLKHFKRTTLGCPVIMGRKTWDSIGRPLPGRRNIVVTRNAAWSATGADAAADLTSALKLVPDAPKVFVIGGAQLYVAALPLVDELVLTEVDAQAPADTFFPAWDRSAFIETHRDCHTDPSGLAYSFVTYQRIKRSPQQQET
jgi:dihydrofolate reductase